MWDLKACTVCFSTKGKLFGINSGPLKRDFHLVSGIKVDDVDGLPAYLCVECSAYVQRCKKFRDKCQRAHFTLKEILKRNNQIKKSNLEFFDTKSIDIKPTLSYVNLDRIQYEEVKFHWVNHNRISNITHENIPVFRCNTLNLDYEFEVPVKKARLSVCNEDNVKEELEEAGAISLQEDSITEDSKEQNFLEQSPSNSNNDETEYLYGNDDEFNSDNDNEIDYGSFEGNEKLGKNAATNGADGVNLDEEYATMVPITMKESKAVLAVYRLVNTGRYCCKVCNKAFNNEDRLKIHLRMHDKHTSGTFMCLLCNFCYKTEFLLKSHMTEKHMYKYLCKKCPEVTYDRTSAKRHFIWSHLNKGYKTCEIGNWYETRPSWLSRKGGNRNRIKRGGRKAPATPMKSGPKMKKVPDDFPIYSPLSQKEQYEIVQQRKNSRNYLEAPYKCDLCYKGFREENTYGKHMKKHDPEVSGKLQCDMCKLYFHNARKMYKHMNITHLFKYSCQLCSYVTYNRGQTHMHYRWHKNVTYQCPHCHLEFKKISTRLTHIRIKHPSTIVCKLCGHSFVSETGLYCHKRLAHTPEEIAASEAAPIDPEDPNYCAECALQFASCAAYQTHLGSSNKHAVTNTSTKPVRRRKGPAKKRGRPRNASSEIVNNGVPTATKCELCGEFLCNDVQARKHYEAEHPGAEFLKRYMCDVCGHTTKQYANLMVHMRTHTNEKPYGCPHCDRRFSMPSNRDRHIVVHTGEKRYECQHCSRRFTQSSAVKLHIQTVHLKIPYAPWDKKNRKRRKELEGSSVPLSAAAVPPPQPKLLLDTHGDYLNAYITYNDE